MKNYYLLRITIYIKFTFILMNNHKLYFTKNHFCLNAFRIVKPPCPNVLGTNRILISGHANTLNCRVVITI